MTNSNWRWIVHVVLCRTECCNIFLARLKFQAAATIHKNVVKLTECLFVTNFLLKWLNKYANSD